MLDALLENPFIIIILLGVISSLFGRGKDSNEEQQRKQRQPRPQQAQPRKMTQTTTPRRDAREMQADKVETFDREKRVQPTIFEAVQTEIESEFEKQRKAHAERLRALENERAALEKQVDDTHTGLQRKQQMKVPSHVNQGKDPFPSYGSRLVDGIVLAEILGKPRAKNPHRER